MNVSPCSPFTLLATNLLFRLTTATMGGVRFLVAMISNPFFDSGFDFRLLSQSLKIISKRVWEFELLATKLAVSKKGFGYEEKILTQSF